MNAEIAFASARNPVKNIGTCIPKCINADPSIGATIIAIPKTAQKIP
jgi:hypothetical protein